MYNLFKVLETEKNQKYCCNKDRSHYKIPLAFFGFSFFYFKKVTVPGSWYPAAGFSNAETVIFISQPWQQKRRSFHALIQLSFSLPIPLLENFNRTLFFSLL